MLTPGKYREWDDSYIVRTVRIVEQPDMWIDDVRVKKAMPVKIPGRLEIKELHQHGLFAVRACIPAAVVYFHITDDFGSLVRMDTYLFAFSSDIGRDNGY